MIHSNVMPTNAPRMPVNIQTKFQPILTPTRANLQALKKPYECEKHNFFQEYMKTLYQEIVNTARSGKTKYVLNGLFSSDKFRDFIFRHPTSEIIKHDEIHSELIELIKKEYEDCTVEYHETKGYEGKIIERIVTIDWS